MQEVPQKQPLSVIGPPFLPLSKISVVPGFHGYDDPETIFELTRRIGKGGFGEVYKATWKPQGKEVALKIMEIENDVDANSVVEEIKLIKSCDSQFVVKYCGSYFKYDKLWIAIEYCDAGSCLDVVRRMRRPFTEKEIQCTMKQVVQGLNYIHSRVPQICHRDIKAGNILLNSKGEAKLADFGISAQITATMRKLNTQIGSPYWMAPEVLSDERYDTKVDIWALGVTAIELAQGKPPWYDQGALRALFLISTKPPPTLTQPEMWSPQFNHFLECCLVRDQSKRLSAADLLQLPFLRDCNDNGPLLKLIQDAVKAAAAESEAEVNERSEASDDDSVDDANNAGRDPVSMSWMSFLTETRATPPPPMPEPRSSKKNKGSRIDTSKKKSSSSEPSKKEKKAQKGLLFWRKDSSSNNTSSSSTSSTGTSTSSGSSSSSANPPYTSSAASSIPIPLTTSGHQKGTSPPQSAGLGNRAVSPPATSTTASVTHSGSSASSSASNSASSTPNPNKTRQQPILVMAPIPPAPSAPVSSTPSLSSSSASISTSTPTPLPTPTHVQHTHAQQSLPPLATGSAPSSATASAASTERSSLPTRSRWFDFFTTNCGLSEEDARNYVILFRSNEIEEDQILDVTEQILKEIGVKVGHALRIMKQVNIIRAQQQQQQPPPM